MPAPKRSNIGYCDYSGGDLNFVIGCTPVSAGCANCYARRIYKWFSKDFSVTIYPDKLERLLKWQPKPPYKRGLGSRPLAFVVDMGDLFHEEVPTDFIARAFHVMGNREDIDWLVLTKRAVRMQSLLEYWWQPKYGPAPNVWPGVTVENEDNLWRIDELLKTPAAVRWVSLEPVLGPIDLRKSLLEMMPIEHIERVTRDMALDAGDLAWEGQPYHAGTEWVAVPNEKIHSVVIGAESGPNRRPFKKEWAWDVLDQCREAGVPCFLKQDSGPRPGVPLLDREGKEVKEWPN